MARIFMRFPEGKAKALTLSYDDGVEQDIKLIEIMVQHGLKGTFNISSGRYATEGTVYPEGTLSRKMTKSVARKVYLNHGMEVAVHGLTHPNLNKFPDNVCAYEVMQDRINLEEDFGTFIRGMAYPYGSYSDSIVGILKMCGIVYSRTVASTGRFDIPTDWLRMPATCHHNDPRLMELARNFTENNTKLDPSLFYLWGHSYEFERDDNWNVIEEFAAYIGDRDDIWYATNIEIYDYIAAYKQLIFTMNGKKVYNPTNTALYFLYESQEVCVKPGETVEIFSKS